MIDLYEELGQVVRALDDEGIEYALCGGLAVAIHGYVRATEDIDLLVQEGDVQAIKACLKKLGYMLDSGTMPLHQSDGGILTAHRVVKSEGSEYLTVDLLVVDAPLAKIWDERIRHDVSDFQVQCVTRAGLVSMKRRSGRNVDLADIERLSE